MRASAKFSIIDVLTMSLFAFGGILSFVNGIEAFSNGLTRDAWSGLLTALLSFLIILLIVQAGASKAFIDTLIEVIDGLKEELKKEIEKNK